MAFDFKKIKSLFVVTDPATDTGDKQTPDNDKKGAKETLATVTPLVKGEIDQKIMDTLYKALADSNTDGFDYFEFKQSLKTLSAMPLDEPTRYKSAFASASTMGVTRDKLIESAGFYAAVLQKEKDKFDEAVKSQNTDNLGKKEQDLTNLKKAILDKSEQIKKLTEEITSNQSAIVELEGVIAKAQARIADTSKNFVASFSSLKGSIDNDIEKIKSFL